MVTSSSGSTRPSPPHLRAVRISARGVFGSWTSAVGDVAVDQIEQLGTRTKSINGSPTGDW